MKEGQEPAFPQPRAYLDQLNNQGITIRDYFAAAALTGYISSWVDCALKPDSIARTAYGIADAMLKAREK